MVLFALVVGSRAHMPTTSLLLVNVMGYVLDATWRNLRFCMVCTPWRMGTTNPHMLHVGVIDHRFHCLRWILLMEPTVGVAYVGPSRTSL